MKEFKLPDPGEGLTEATIIAWKVKEGDQVKVNDIIVEIETSKSLVELPSPWTGKVAKILVAEGTEDVPVGTPIIVIDDGTSAPMSVSAATDDEETGPNLVGYGTRPGSSVRRARKDGATSPHVQAAVRSTYAGPNVEIEVPSVEIEDETTPELTVPVAGSGKPHDVVLAKPPVRKYAKDRGVDLTQVVPTGPNSTITREDIDAYVSASQQPATASSRVASSARVASGLADKRESIKGVRKVTAKAMVDSAFTKVHVTEWVEVDVTATMELLDTLRARREFRDQKLSPLLIYAKAVCLAMKGQPSINASWDEAKREIIYHGNVNLGIAAATPRGLLVPNIKSADAMSLLELNKAINDLVKVAKDGALQPTDYSGGTFTITNVGVFGIESGTPIINGSESAILAMGAITRKPWVVGKVGVDERIEPRWVTTIALSFDHRLIDGEQGSKFLRDVADILTHPQLALLF